VLCSHGELIGAVLECLVGHDLDDAVELAWPKASTWVLDVDDGRLRQRHYLPPLRLHDTEAGYQGTSLSHRSLPGAVIAHPALTACSGGRSYVASFSRHSTRPYCSQPDHTQRNALLT
jgi:hypothetical protein